MKRERQSLDTWQNKLFYKNHKLTLASYRVCDYYNHMPSNNAKGEMEKKKMKYTHALNKNTYVAIRSVSGGVEFRVQETGEVKTLTNHQVARLLSKVGA